MTKQHLREGDKMAYLLAYTQKRRRVLPGFNYPGHVGYNCDWEQAMHLALSEDGKEFLHHFEIIQASYLQRHLLKKMSLSELQRR